MSNFAGQWLYLRNLAQLKPDPDVFPEFDESLRQAFQQETELFFENILREDRSVLDLLDAELHVPQPAPGGALRHPERLRLAVPQGDAHRSESRRPAGAGQHSHGDVVSQPHVGGAARQVDSREPAGHAAAAAAAGCSRPEAARADDGKLLTMREQMEQHRANAVCAACHARMDPIGFALENYDGVGQVARQGCRQRRSTPPASCPDGTQFRRARPG